MKVLLVNGSPHAAGCTYTALSEVARSLEKHGLDTAFFQLGAKPVRGCVACGKCAELGRCVFTDDACGALLDAMAQADGIVIGSPVYYAGPNGALLAVLDRVFYAGSARLRYKPAAAVVSCRRGGASAAFDRLNKYFSINRMPIVTSQYWNSVHGNTPEEVRRDLEGLQVMRALGDDMAWMLQSLQRGGQPLPEPEPRAVTNFIR